MPTEETRPTHLATLLTRFNRQTEAALPPEVPPPFPLEQLLHQEAVAEAMPAVEVSIEKVPDAEDEAARQRLQEAFEAAEHDQDLPEQELPEEAKNERRAELMPEPDPIQEVQNRAAVVGQILSDLHQKTAAAFAAFSRIAPTMPSSLPLPAAYLALPALYKKAILGGFAGAIVSLIMIAILA